MSDEQSHEKQVEKRLYKKLLAKIQYDMNAGNVKSQSKQIDDHTWICVGSGAVAENAPSDNDDPSIFRLSQDMYAILATASWRSIPFWVSILVIFGFQYVLILMLLADTADMSSDDNIFNLPANVETSVRVGQVMLLFIALFRQRDLLSGIASLVRDLPDQFCGSSDFAGMTRLQWRLSAIVQLIQGLLNFLVSFILVAQSQTVPNVILTVLGVAFISDLDELAFQLCTEGYLGGSMKRMSKDVRDVRFHRTIPNRKVWKDAHIIGAFTVLFFALVAFGCLAIRQESGVYSVQDIRIEFGDEVLPFLGLFNGCYRKSQSIEQMGGRLVYEQVGYPNGGKFGFCSAFGKGAGGWTFFIGDVREDEICESYILRSGATSTFDLLEAGKTKWFTYDDLAIDFLEITENKAPTTECGQSIFMSSKDACPSILAFDTMPMTKLSPSARVDVDARSERSLDAAFSHPIYYSNNDGNGSFALTFFTGRRWIRTYSDHIKGLGNETSVVHMEDFFFAKNGLFKVIDQLRKSVVDEEAELVSAVSEIVDTKRDQGSPLGLLWYLPRHGGKINSMTETETDKLQRNFPSANLARPIDTAWTCLVCNEDTNPCFYGGVCDAEKGTCVCKHGETGNLCQQPPLGNGICNLYFNKAEYNYDGGDCCAGTCKGEDCGKDDLPDPFLGLAGAYVDEDGWYYPFQNKTNEWKKTFHQREFAYGVNIVGNEYLAMEKSDPPLRFNHCIDPNTVLLTVELKEYTNVETGTIALAKTTVRCDGSPYLHVPRFEITNNRRNYIFKEEVRVPYGAQCEFRIWDWDNETEISIFAENSSVPFLQQEGDPYGEPISLSVPESECVWDAFGAHQIPPVFTENEYQEFAGGVDMESMCNRDPGEILERYAVWKMINSLSDEEGASRNFDGHICDKMYWGGLKTWCGDDGLRVSEVWDIAGDTLPSEIWSLTQLTELSIWGKDLRSLPSDIGRLVSLAVLDVEDNQLTWIPSEMGRLTSLTSLHLSGNQLTSLPSEIGRLVSLAVLDVDDNQLTWIPSEMGRLTSLTSLHLRGNQLISLPSEIGRLGSLSELDLMHNQLTLVVSEMGLLTSLTVLNLEDNQLKSLPSEIGKLTSLAELELENNNLRSIPSEVGSLKSVTWLSLEFNPVTWDSLPIEVQHLESEGTQIDVCDSNFGEDGCIEYSS